MALTVKQIVNRHGAFVSAVTALAVFVALLVQQVLQILINALTFPEILLYGFSFVPYLAVAIPFAIGFFVSLWIIAPIAEELRVPHVVTRAVLATGVASTVVFIVLAVTGVFGAVHFDGYLFSNSLHAPGFDGSVAVQALGRALTSAALTFVTTLPLGVLAGVMLWLWRKDHPPRHPLSGLIDEV